MMDVSRLARAAEDAVGLNRDEEEKAGVVEVA